MASSSELLDRSLPEESLPLVELEELEEEEELFLLACCATLLASGSGIRGGRVVEMVVTCTLPMLETWRVYEGEEGIMDEVVAVVVVVVVEG